MKYTQTILIAICAFLFCQCSNQKKLSEPNCYKGRLEIKANCFNYTIKVLEGNIDTTKFVAAWTDETTGKSYTNVFALGSHCSFPSTLNAGDEFYFRLDTVKQGCPVCMMYYPKPSKSLMIKVLDGPCK